MKVNVINEYRVEMELAENELTDFDITYESMDYGDINTRRFLRELAENAKQLGVDADMSGKVLIEAFRVSGGCKVCFTFLPPRGKNCPSVKQLVKKDLTCLCAVSTDVSLLCGYCAGLGYEPESTLFFCGGSYMLFIYSASEMIDRCTDTAAEFGVRFCDNAPVLLAKAREHGVCLAEHNAVSAAAAM